MPDYKKMYTNLFNKVTDIIEELQKAQKETEELYIQSYDTEPVELISTFEDTKR